MKLRCSRFRFRYGAGYTDERTSCTWLDNDFLFRIVANHGNIKIKENEHGTKEKQQAHDPFGSLGFRSRRVWCVHHLAEEGDSAHRPQGGEEHQGSPEGVVMRIQVDILGRTHSFPHEPAALRFIRSLKGCWNDRDEVRFVSPEGTFLARWTIDDFLK